MTRNKLGFVWIASTLTTVCAAQCELTRLTASDGTEHDSFGGGVNIGSLGIVAGNSVAISGDTMLVGARWHDHVVDSAGAVYVFEKIGGQWVETQELLASDGAAGDSFGFAVAIDGDLAAISASFKGPGDQQGAAYVFRRTAGTWVEEARVTASDGVAYDWFGTSIDISNERVLVGSPRSDPSGTDSGAAYVYERQGASWVETAKLVVTGGTAGDWAGISVGLEGDAALLGAYRRPAVGHFSGGVYAFSFVQGAWSQSQEILPLDIAAGDQFGVSLTIDQGRVLVGSRFEEPTGTSPGVVYVFEPVAGGWVEDALLAPSDGAVGDWFGYAVALDGDRALVGAPLAFNTEFWAGAAYTFERDAAGWAETAKLLPSDPGNGDFFGWAVGLDAGSYLVGAPAHDDLGNDSGAAYVFDDLCRVGRTYCSPAVPNTTGLPGTLLATGSAEVAQGDLTLTAEQLPPGQFGYFLVGEAQGFFNPPGAAGFICLAGSIGRFNRPVEIVVGPTGSLALDLTALPLTPPRAVQPGDTWNFQCWYRDLGATSNFTDAVSILFL